MEGTTPTVSVDSWPKVTLADLGDGIQIARIEQDGMSFEFERARMFDITYRDAGNGLLSPPTPNAVLKEPFFGKNDTRFPFVPSNIGFYAQTVETRSDGWDIVTPVKIPLQRGVVTVRIKIRITDDDVRLGIDVDGNLLGQALHRVIFPILKVKPIGEPDDDVLLMPPVSSGEIILDPAHRNGFPSIVTHSVQLGAYYQPGGPMLYFQTEDPGGWLKDYWFEGRGTSTLLYMVNYPPNAARPGNAPTTSVTWTMPYPFVLAVMKGDWYDAARRYRTWALQQPWAKRGPIRTSPEFSDIMRNGEVTVLRYAEALHAEDVIRLRNFLGTDRIQTLWAGWHTNPFDQGWPDYGVRRTFPEEVRRAHESGVAVAAYTMIHLWDVTSKTWQRMNGPMRSVQDENRRTVLLQTAPGALFGQIDPARADSRRIMLEIWKPLKEQLGVDGFYLDFWSGLPPARDFDPSLARPGDTAAFVAGKRALGQTFKEALKGWNGTTFENPDFYLISETVDENLIDKLDGAGAGVFGSNYPSSVAVPVWTVVYHERLIVGGIVNLASFPTGGPIVDEEQAFERLAFVYHWGWNPTLYNADPQHTLISDPVEETPGLDFWRYLKMLTASEPIVRRFRVFGEMMRPLPGSIEDLVDKTSDLPATGVRSSVWKDGDDLAVLLTNIGETTESFTVTLSRDRYPLEDSVRLVEYADGNRSPRATFNDVVSFEVSLPARSLRIFEVVPAASIHEDDPGLIARALTIQKPVGVATVDAFSKAVPIVPEGPVSVTVVLESRDLNTSAVRATVQFSNDGESWKDSSFVNLSGIGHGTISFDRGGAALLRIKFTLLGVQTNRVAAAVCGARARGVEE